MPTSSAASDFRRFARILWSTWGTAARSHRCRDISVFPEDPAPAARDSRATARVPVFHCTPIPPSLTAEQTLARNPPDRRLRYKCVQPYNSQQMMFFCKSVRPDCNHPSTVENWHFYVGFARSSKANANRRDGASPNNRTVHNSAAVRNSRCVPVRSHPQNPRHRSSGLGPAGGRCPGIGLPSSGPAI
jgi:hypothetical protein